jgi:hypothetical protein
VGLNHYIEVHCTHCGLDGCCHVAELFGSAPNDILGCCRCNSEMVQTRWGPLWPWKGPPVTIENALSEYKAWAAAHAKAFSRHRHAGER